MMYVGMYVLRMVNVMFSYAKFYPNNNIST